MKDLTKSQQTQIQWVPGTNKVYQSVAQGVWFRKGFQWAQDRENGKIMIVALK